MKKYVIVLRFDFCEFDDIYGSYQSQADDYMNSAVNIITDHGFKFLHFHLGEITGFEIQLEQCSKNLKELKDKVVSMVNNILNSCNQPWRMAELEAMLLRPIAQEKGSHKYLMTIHFVRYVGGGDSEGEYLLGIKEDISQKLKIYRERDNLIKYEVSNVGISLTFEKSFTSITRAFSWAKKIEHKVYFEKFIGLKVMLESGPIYVLEYT